MYPRRPRKFTNSQQLTSATGNLGGHPSIETGYNLSNLPKSQPQNNGNLEEEAGVETSWSYVDPKKAFSLHLSLLWLNKLLGSHLLTGFTVIFTLFCSRHLYHPLQTRFSLT